MKKIFILFLFIFTFYINNSISFASTVAIKSIFLNKTLPPSFPAIQSIILNKSLTPPIPDFPSIQSIFLNKTLPPSFPEIQSINLIKSTFPNVPEKSEDILNDNTLLFIYNKNQIRSFLRSRSR